VAVFAAFLLSACAVFLMSVFAVFHYTANKCPVKIKTTSTIDENQLDSTCYIGFRTVRENSAIKVIP